MAYISIDQPTAPTLFNRIATAFVSMRQAQANNALFRVTLAELRGLSDRELHDLGLSRSSLIEVAREAVYNK
ncbi:MAG: DUF1127 domain-containing protein [Rhodobacteraceae bacterium]|nr:DUF1127 domain-containing protein [Paracoccaceae bacterium]